MSDDSTTPVEEEVVVPTTEEAPTEDAMPETEATPAE
jgi:hypothetical protein